MQTVFVSAGRDKKTFLSIRVSTGVLLINCNCILVGRYCQEITAKCLCTPQKLIML